ncbi:Osmotin-like protein OSM34 [Capsicum chinense]|nr:Osmotin-like protein OSM34 [Capsicum chinense]
MTTHILTRNYVVRVYTRRNDSLNSSLKVQGVTQTGDYSGLLKCQGFGEPPNTLAEYALNQLDNSDFFDISLVDGFNVPMEFTPTSAPTAQQAAPVIDIRNNCPFTVWAAAVPGGGQRLDYGGVWRIQLIVAVFGVELIAISANQAKVTVKQGTAMAFSNAKLMAHPQTLAEYALNQFNNLDFFNISLVNGFNLPMEFRPTSTDNCPNRISCTADIIG